jgi:hypothetical protein
VSRGGSVHYFADGVRVAEWRDNTRYLETGDSELPTNRTFTAT